MREPGGRGANDLSESNVQLLVGPERGFGGQICDLLEEAGSLKGGRGAGKDGVFEGLGGLSAQWAGRVGIRIVPRGVCREVTLTRAHLVYSTRNKFAQAHKEMGAY